MFGKVINFFRGTVYVELESSYAEQILNALHRAKIGVWRVRRTEPQSVCFTVRERDFEQVEKIAARYFAQVGKKVLFGKTRWITRYRKRWTLLAALLLAVIGFAVMNCFIWEVQVTGCTEKLSESEVADAFQQMGLSVGKLRFGIDADTLENEFLLQNKDAIWVSVNMHFTTAQIEVRERGNTPQIYDLSTPCDIYAARDGLITEMMVTNGTALVKEGDTVQAGDMLISRRHESKYGEVSDVHALGYVRAKTKRVLSVTLPRVYNAHTPTGKTKKFYTLRLFNFKIPLYFKQEMSYNNYDETEFEKTFKIGALALPFGYERKTFTEVDITREHYDDESLKAQALGKLTALEKKNLCSADILEKEIKEEETDEAMTLQAEYTCLEDIALTLGDQ